MVANIDCPTCGNLLFKLPSKFTQANVIHLSVKYGSKVLPLASDGSNAIVCANKDALLQALKTLKKAVLDGELDAAITEASNFTKTSFIK